MDYRLEQLAVETLSEALVAPTAIERTRLMERALRLHQRAYADEPSDTDDPPRGRPH
jgi:hypothetical protein